MKFVHALAVGALAGTALGSWAVPAHGGLVVEQPCRFTTTSSRMLLQGDCVTTASIKVPNGKTFDGQGYLIRARDPLGGHFMGAVITNAGATANVRNVRIVMTNMADFCRTGADRLAGIMFSGASGKIESNYVEGPNLGPSSTCGEGSAIRLHNEPLDGSHTRPADVQVRGNVVADFQIYGIVAVGNVKAAVKGNEVYIGHRAGTRPTGIAYVYGGYGKASGNLISGAPEGKGTSVGSRDELLGGSLGMLAYDSRGGAVFENNTVEAVQTGAISGSSCFHGGTNDKTHFNANTITAYDWGIGVEAGVSQSLCAPLNYKTKVRGNAISGYGWPDSIGVIARNGQPADGYTPIVSHTEIADNVISAFATCIVDTATKTKVGTNMQACEGPMLTAPKARATRSPAS